MLKKAALIVLAGLWVSACTNLDLVPVSQKSVEGFYKTETHINQAISGCYNGLRTVWVTSLYSYGLTEARSDNTFQGREYDDGPVSQFNETASLPMLYNAWADYYAFINRTNKVLEALGQIEMTDARRKQYEGEAKFMRAMFYFDLARLFGGVPKVTSSLSMADSYNTTRSTLEETYDLIIADLEEAVQLLPAGYDAADKGRITSLAASAYLGKVYLFRSGYPLKKNEWEKARNAFSVAINSRQFRFFQEYADIYDYTNEAKEQQLFSIQFKSATAGNGNPFPTRNASNDIALIPIADGGLPFGGSPYNLFLSDNLINSFETGDIRKDVAVRTSWKHKSGATITTIPTCQKYQNGPVAGASDWDIDWIALSYTDVLMMYAECLNEIGYSNGGEAFEILNDIRTRAGLSAKTAADVPDQQAFRLWLEEERRKELCFENVRWFDLVRTDRAFDVMKAFLGGYGLEGNLKSKDQYLYPVPQRVLDITPVISQNPGY